MSNIRELSQLAASIVVDDSTRNIGIGTSNPLSKLSVGGDLNISGVITATSFYGDGSNIVGISSDSFTLNGQEGSYYLNYDNFTNKPFIPADTSDLTNNAGFVTSGIIVGYATEGFVSQQVSNLIDSAPTALDTLNELSAALGDDPNFATTITNSLASKANLSGADFTGIVTATSFIGDGSNLTGIAVTTLSYESSKVSIAITDKSINFTSDDVLVATISSTGFFINVPLDMSDNAISRLAAPSSLSDAVNKDYVDNQVAGDFPTGDYGDLSSGDTDSFGQIISAFTDFDCLTTPSGSLDSTDLGVLT
jgi:hypothetical protein